LQFQQAQEISRGLGKDLKKVPRRLEMVMSRPEMQQRLRLANWLALSWLLACFAVSVVLLLFLYLGHDWARLALGSLCLIAGFWALFGCVFGGMAALMFPGGIGAMLALLEMLFRLGVNFGVGAALMRSESIAAYTAGR
jgi:hypothetical protein